MIEKNWHNLSIENIFQKLGTNENGINNEQAKERLKKYKENILPKEKKFSIIKIIIEQFKSPLVYILLIASIISFLLKEFIDMWIILSAVFINAIIGFFQEYKAEKTFLHLRKLVQYKSRVLRKDMASNKSNESIINNKYIVPGDIIILKPGDVVGADARIIKSNGLKVKEAILTGESTPSLKHSNKLSKNIGLADKENMIYAGTNIVGGTAMAIVIATGSNTELGKIANLIKSTTKEKTPLQNKIAHMAGWLGIIIGIMCLILFVSGVMLGRPFFEMLLISVAVAVAGIPEGLAIAVTVCLAVGMQAILQKKALIKKLIATETLGSITVIASDKTGTLTEGRMTVVDIIPHLSKTGSQELLKIGLLCNNAIIKLPEDKTDNPIINGDPTEIALLTASMASELERKAILKKYPRIDELPFESKNMYMATLHKVLDKQNKKELLVKGAPEKIINLSSLNNADKQAIITKTNTLTSKGLRVIAFAKKISSQQNNTILKEDLQNLEFIGLIAIKDPLRKNAKQTIKTCELAGIKPIIMTGDHELTAKAIAIEIGLIKKNEKILIGKELDKMSDKELGSVLKTSNVYARVEPKHKIRIINLLQKQGEIVAMAGDGVNDAPAIKAANIGISLGSGSEITKQTAEMILIDNNFQTILEAIKQGRNIFQNIKKIILFLLADIFTEFILIGSTLLMGFPLPLIAGQILWINIIEDTLPAMALSYEKGNKNILKEKKTKTDSKLLDSEMKVLIFIIGIITDFILFGLFLYLYYYKNLDISYIRTMIFAGLGIDTLFIVFSCKNLRQKIWEYNPFDNYFLNLSVIFGWAMLIIAVYLPFFQKILQTTSLNYNDWLILISLGLINLVLIEIGKSFYITKKQKT
ncbi:HAD-IC family P-type ATPase [Patescibacteria group bacterium]|nr:HAD-IC family P-type ATPase [Patescibacteria group bacterium]